jgi:hypothetical protein
LSSCSNDEIGSPFGLPEKAWAFSIVMRDGGKR